MKYIWLAIATCALGASAAEASDRDSPEYRAMLQKIDGLIEGLHAQPKESYARYEFYVWSMDSGNIQFYLIEVAASSDGITGGEMRYGNAVNALSATLSRIKTKHLLSVINKSELFDLPQFTNQGLSPGGIEYFGTSFSYFLARRVFGGHETEVFRLIGTSVPAETVFGELSEISESNN